MKRLISSLPVLCMVAGCGDSAETAQTGFFAGLVSGVEYETATHVGVTDERGGFQYEEGELVTFRIGDTVLGETFGEEQVTPFDLAGVEVITDGWRGITRAGQRFYRVVNMLVLLHTFGRDLDGTNGIEITDDVAALFEGVEVPLRESPRRFRRNRDFRRTLNQANAAGLLAGYGVVADPVAALTDLYETLGVTPGFFDADSREIDSDGDGLIDEVLTFRYDARGHRVFETRHEIGSPVVVIEREFGPVAQTTLETEDIAADGFADTVYRTELSRDGDPTRYTTDLGADGVIDRISGRSYNEYGQVVSSFDDDDGDSRADRVTRWTYADAGDWEARSIDDDGDGATDRVTRTFFAAMGRPSRVEYDEHADGSIDTIQTNRYDDAGNLVEFVHDGDADGVPDTVHSKDYDASGKEIRSTEDTDGDGEPESVTISTYDEDGNRILLETDRGLDGTIDGHTINTYDERGNLTRTRTDNDGDGTIDYQRTAEYDENGFQVFMSQDNDGDGVPQYAVTSAGVPVGWAYYFWD